MPVGYVWELFDWKGCKDEGKSWCCDGQSLSQRILTEEVRARPSSSPGQELVSSILGMLSTDPATVPAINAGAQVSHSWRQGLLRGPHPLKEQVSSYTCEMPTSIMLAMNFINVLFLPTLKPSLALLHTLVPQKQLLESSTTHLPWSCRFLPANTSTSLFSAHLKGFVLIPTRMSSPVGVYTRCLSGNQAEEIQDISFVPLNNHRICDSVHGLFSWAFKCLLC